MQTLKNLGGPSTVAVQVVNKLHYDEVTKSLLILGPLRDGFTSVQ